MSLPTSSRTTTRFVPRQRPPLYLVPPLVEDPEPEPLLVVERAQPIGVPEHPVHPPRRPVEPPSRPVGPARMTGPAARVRRHVRPPVRLTRRGRLVVALVLFTLVVGVIAALATAGQAAAPARAPVAIVVRQGDTLWSIAARGHAGSVVATMNEIMRLNHMRDATVYVGQQLLVPAES